MRTLTFNTTVTAPKQKVWDTMINPETYKEWTNVAWPGSDYKGEWAEGKYLRFNGPDGSGTLAHLVAFKPYDLITAEHMAILLPGGIEDKESDMAKGWVGTIEQYEFVGEGDTTDLTITMKIAPEWAEMFNNDWPKALAKLKEICER